MPKTIYQKAGDSVSGVAGLLLPEPWQFIKAAPSRVGTTVIVTDDDGVEYEATVEWDGAMLQPPFETVLDDGSVEIRQEHSKGILLAGYQLRQQSADMPVFYQEAA